MRTSGWGPVILGGLVVVVAVGSGCRKREWGLEPTIEEETLEYEMSAESFPIAEFSEDPDTAAYRSVHFDFDRDEIKPDEVPVLQGMAKDLKATPRKLLLIEGHCDEHGTNEYNLGLGERRALATRSFLIDLGVAPTRIHTISYGEEDPVALGHDKESWAQNRRCEFKTLVP